MATSKTETYYASPQQSSQCELERQMALLREEARLASLLEAIPNIVMILNKNRQIVMGSSRLYDLADTVNCRSFFGLRPGELFSCCHVSDTPSGCGTGEACSTCGTIEAILEAISGKKNAHECRLLTRKATGIEAMDLKISATPFVCSNESFVLVIATDISDEKRRHVLEKIFFHDLLNTASAIQTISDLLNEGILTLDEAIKDLQETTGSLVNEIRSHRQLLAAENGELKATLTPLNSLLLLQSIRTTCKNLKEAAKIELVIDKKSVDSIFMSDETLVTRVMVNLAKNALEASSPGQNVTLGCSLHDDKIQLWCHNEGYIPRPIQLQIFHRSFSTKDKGRGLGTYSVKLLAERYLGGTVSFDSSEKSGTTFTITLPLNK